MAPEESKELGWETFSLSPDTAKPSAQPNEPPDIGEPNRELARRLHRMAGLPLSAPADQKRFGQKMAIPGKRKKKARKRR